MLKAILNAMVHGVRVAGENLENTIKSGGDLEKVGNKIVAIASMNTCKQLENYKQILHLFLGKSVSSLFSYSNY